MREIDFTGLVDLPDDFDLGNLRQALRLFDGRRGVALDIGAHRGIWSREMARHFRYVLAVEPTPLCRQINLEKTPAINVINMAMEGGGYAPTGRVRMKAGKENTGQTHCAEDGEYIQTARTVDWLTRGVGSIDFIKIDVEGMEWHVLKGAEQTILKHRPAIMIEENGLCTRYGVTPEQTHAAITDHGYDLAGRWNKDYLYLPC